MEKFLLVEGIIAAQTPGVVSAFNSILDEFDTIIEIGFDRGGFSLWLDQNKSPDTKLVCYDISFNNKLVNGDIDFRQADCLAESTVDEIKDLIEKSNKTLLLCDGGNKEIEFKLYSKYLKSGDVIMLHDFAEDKREYWEFAQKVGWTSASESHLVNIEECISQCNLEKYNYDLFKSVFWGSFIKA